jgi:RNA polymerase sigma factor (sigma-70 family)
MSAVLEPTDPELVALARSGDHASYGRLVARHQTLVVSLAYSICGDFARSQDIAQEAFINAWQQLPTLADPKKFKSWLCGITRNLAHNFIRQQTRRGDQPVAAAELEQELPASGPGPREQAVTREESLIIWRALEQLPEAFREPLILFYREHQSVERVAAALDLSEDTVKQRLSRGRGMLRNQVENLVERSLGFTTPGVMFTTAVVVALPVITTPIITTNAAAAVTKGSALAKAPFALTKLLPSFLIHLGVAYGGRYWQSKRRTSPSKWLFRVALIIWGAIAATVAVLWFVARA